MRAIAQHIQESLPSAEVNPSTILREALRLAELQLQAA